MSQRVPEKSLDDELLAELKKVGSSLAFRQEVRRILKIVAGVAIVALISSLLAIYAISEIRDYQNIACTRDNDLRKAYTDQWGPTLKDSPPPVPPPEDAPPEVVEAYNNQVQLRKNFEKSLEAFAQHPC